MCLCLPKMVFPERLFQKWSLTLRVYIYNYISWIWINIRIPNKDRNAIILRIWPLDVFRGFNEFLRSQLISECRGSNMTVESPCLLRVMPADLSWGWGCQWIRKLASVMLEWLKRHENSWKYTPNLFGWWFWRWLKTVGTSFQQIIWFIPLFQAVPYLMHSFQRCLHSCRCQGATGKAQAAVEAAMDWAWGRASWALRAMFTGGEAWQTTGDRAKCR